MLLKCGKGKTMAFLDDIGNKAKEISTTSKYNSALNAEKAKLKETYAAIGELYCAKHPTDPEPVFSMLVDRALVSIKKIDEYKESINKIKGITKCEKCGAEIPVGVAFCTACGARVEKKTFVPPVGSIVCPKCGGFVKEGMKFCTSCGNVMSGEASAPAVEPAAPAVEPVAPAVEPVAPVVEPVAPVVEPAAPVVEPTAPAVEPVAPAVEPAAPADSFCPNCGNPCADDAIFCENCGFKIDSAPEAPVEIPANVCPNCGAELEEDSAFCTECGFKL